METSRRGFLKMLGLGATVVAAEPVRRYWFFGLDLKAPEPELVPVEGQPGLWRNTRTQEIISFRDWRESDKYDTIFLPADNGLTYNAGLSFVIPTLEEVKRIGSERV